MIEEEEPVITDDVPSRFAARPELKTRRSGKNIWGKSEVKPADEAGDGPFKEDLPDPPAPTTQLKLGAKAPGSQSELAFDSAPRGRFEGENPNVFDGEDLDLPPFLRKKKS